MSVTASLNYYMGRIFAKIAAVRHSILHKIVGIG